MAQTLRDLFNMYGGKWYDIGTEMGYPGWFRSPHIDPIGQPVWSPMYGWQDAATIKKLKGDFSSLTPNWGRWEQYWQPKPQGTSDPELRSQYGGQNWMNYYKGDPYFNEYAAQNPWTNAWGGQSLWTGGGSGQPNKPETGVSQETPQYYNPPASTTPTDPYQPLTPEQQYQKTTRQRRNPWLNL